MKKMAWMLIVLIPLYLSVATVTGQSGKTAKETAFQAIDRNKAEIEKVGNAIYSFAELGM